MHLFLYGNPGVGKSTVLQRALTSHGGHKIGFLTRKIESGGMARVYLNDAAQAPLYGGSTLVARWRATEGRGRENLEVYPERFDALGRAALASLPAGQVVLMDEIGLLERDAQGFRGRILEALDAPCRILGVIKEQDDDFLRKVKAHPRVRTLEVTRENRDQALSRVERFLTPPSLARALGVERGVTALVGGGGKTTLMRRLGEELQHQGRVVLCTSTHVMRPDMTVLIDPEAGEVSRALEQERLIFIGGYGEDGRLGPCGLVTSGEVKHLADYVIVEADGSKRLPFKAPAGHEPVLPPGTGHVVAVAGMSGMYLPIREVCHRPHLYAALVGKEQDAPVTPADCALVLSHPQGQRKGVTGKFSVLLNQAETPEGFAAAAACAAALEGDAVIASLRREQPVLEHWRSGTCAW